MSYRSGPRSTGYLYRGNFTPAVKWLLLINTALFVIYFFCANVFGAPRVFDAFLLRPSDVITRYEFWQLVTYQFLHSPFGFGHILFNMLILFFMGPDLEVDWGTGNFLKFYLLCGVVAGVCVVLAPLITNADPNVPTLGASGALYGLIVAYGLVMYPNREVSVWGIVMIRAKYLAIIMIAIEFMSSLAASGGGPVSHIAHLGGAVFGYVYLRGVNCFRGRAISRVRRPSLLSSAKEWYREYKLRRARKKFDVYLKKRHSDQDRWVH